MGLPGKLWFADRRFADPGTATPKFEQIRPIQIQQANLTLLAWYLQVILRGGIIGN